MLNERERELLIVLLDDIYNKVQEGGEKADDALRLLAVIYPDLFNSVDDIGQYARFEQVNEGYLEQIELVILDLIEKLKKRKGADNE